MVETAELDGIREVFRNRRPEMEAWKESIIGALESDPQLKELRPILVKGRIKGEEELAAKVAAKFDPEYRRITRENLFNEIEDVVGVRLVLAQKGHLSRALKRIRKLEETGAWSIQDEVHYVWHPEEIREVAEEGRDPETKSFAYCSRHLILVRPNVELDSPHLVKCELQVRTVLEEAVFENDHRIRYKKKHGKMTGRVLARLAEMLEVADRLLLDAYEVAEEEGAAE